VLQMCKILERSGAQIVYPEHLMTFSKKGIGQVRTEETRSSCN